MAETCIVCKKPIREGQRVMPTYVATDSTRYDAVIPTSSPTYLHAYHLLGEPR